MTTGDPGRRGGVPARPWYGRGVVDVARDLLGCHLTTVRDDGVVTVRITEVEAYGGADDPGSHAYRGRTARNGAMFGEPGRLYVYRHLGLHHCANIVAHQDGEASAVLLRAGEVVSGTDLARARRDAAGTAGSAARLASGPGRLAVCLALDLADDGADVTRPGGPVVLERHEGAGTPVGRGPRVGVSGPGGDEELYPWRCWLAGDPTVSPYRRAYRRPASAARRG